MTTASKNRLRYWREQRGLTRAQLAERVNSAPGQIQRLENGQRRLSTIWIDRLAAALDVPATALISDTPISPTNTPGFSAPEAEPFRGDFDQGSEPNADWWQINSKALDLAGILPGDFILVDLSASPQEGQPVIAQRYRSDQGTAETLLRLYQPPFLVTHSTALPLTPILIDSASISIMGVAIQVRRFYQKK